MSTLNWVRAQPKQASIKTFLKHKIGKFNLVTLKLRQEGNVVLILE